MGGYKWWDGRDNSGTITRRSHDQFMPDKGNFEAVVKIENIRTEPTAPCLTKQLSEQSGQDLGQPGNIVAAVVEEQVSFTSSSFGGYLEGVGTLKKSGGDLGGAANH